jgi:ZIP family zinc transporter
MGAALGWGAVAASSLVIGALLGLARSWSAQLIGLILAFGAGALVSAVSFELWEEGAAEGSLRSVAFGLAAGALVYFTLARALDRRSGSSSSAGPDSGGPLALGALLDGIPEQAVLGLGLGAGETISVGLLVAIFVSNLPEAIGSSADMLAAGRPRGFVLRLWLGVAAICTVSTVAGYGIADATGGELKAAINGFAAGALLVMLVDSMIPEATEKVGRRAGLATVLGFALAAGLSSVS